MDVNVIDDFLPQEEFEKIRDLIMWNVDFAFYMQKSVSTFGDDNCLDHGFWNWYATHVAFRDDDYNSPTGYRKECILSRHFQLIYDTFIPRFEKMGIYTRLQRIKINMYPHTKEVMEHKPHYDTDVPHRGALFSLNTCNGFTKLHEGTKIDSVENRLMLFHPNYLHNSSTASNVPARYNINFNFQ